MTAGAGTEIKRLNWGCGGWPEPGWINSDLAEFPGIDLVCDILEGLPLDSESIDYIVSIHALPEIPYPDLPKALSELKRVLKKGGTIRLALPDLEKGIEAHRSGDRDYFLVPDDEWERIGSKLVVQLIWYGHSRTLFNHDFIEELLEKAGFSDVRRCAFKETRSPFPEIVELDNREQESLFIEAVK